jgi:hypothetical protein
MTDQEKGGGVHISGGNVTVGGDVVGGDKITTGNISGTSVAIGRGAKAVGSLDLAALLAQWQAQMEAKIDAQPNVSADDKKDLKEHVGKIQAEAAKGEQADPSRLEKLINTLAVIGPDIFDVAVTTLVNPLGGIGLALKKIGDKAKLERSKQSAEA